MADEAKKAEGEPSKTPAEKTEEKTVGAIIEESTGGEPKKPEADTVPLATFLEMKKDVKKFEKLYNELKDKADAGNSSKEEIADDLDELAKEFDIEPKFVNRLAKILEGKADKKAGEAIKPILERDAALSKKEKDALIDAAFKKHYAEALEKMPEYNEIANADAIKALSLLPQNADKTFPQLIEETYGRAITGKRTIDPIKPGGGKEPEPIDYEKAKSDTAYFSEIMKDPARKAEYNKRMLEPRGRRS